jgi:hypothetical protein
MRIFKSDDQILELLEIKKAGGNPYHDAKGRFTNQENAAGGTPGDVREVYEGQYDIGREHNAMAMEEIHAAYGKPETKNGLVYIRGRGKDNMKYVSRHNTREEAIDHIKGLSQEKIDAIEAAAPLRHDKKLRRFDLEHDFRTKR